MFADWPMATDRILTAHRRFRGKRDSDTVFGEVVGDQSPAAFSSVIIEQPTRKLAPDQTKRKHGLSVTPRVC